VALFEARESPMIDAERLRAAIHDLAIEHRGNSWGRVTFRSEVRPAPGQGRCTV
jgi:hypothetical protein